MGIGELTLASIGQQNYYLTHNPQITYFKNSFKRHTNFSNEYIPQYFKILPDFSRKTTVNISKNGDLLNNILLYIELPSLPVSNHSFLPNDIKKIAWTENIAINIIKFIDIEIGNVLIDRHYADWIHIYHELTNDINQKKSYNKMIGNIKKLTEYSNGKDKYICYLPLSFWFCLDSGLAFPLTSLRHHEVKIHVQFNDFKNCVKESPTHYFETDSKICLFNKGEIIKQTINGNDYLGEFVYFDVETQRIYYNKIKDDFQIPNQDNILYNITGEISEFTLQPKINSIIIQDESYFYYGTPALENAYLLVNYIFLDNDERFKFLKNNHQYLIPLIQNIPEQTLYTTNNHIKLPFVNPNKTIFYKTTLKSNIDINNHFNYNCYPLNRKDKEIIQKHLLYINSIKRIEIDDYNFYSVIQNYKNKFNTNKQGIYSISFSIDPLEYQPSGTFNFSKANDSYLKLSLNSKIDYQNPVVIKVFGQQYNILNIKDGLAELEFYL